jgi:aryl-alcohol dehydrogenase-like predicted oxidoreductase
LGLEDEGKIRHLGVSNFHVAQMRRAQNVALITSLQPQYSLVAMRAAGALAQLCIPLWDRTC